MIIDTGKKFRQPRFSLPLPANDEFPYYVLPPQLIPVLEEGVKSTNAPREMVIVTMIGAMSLAEQGVAKVSVIDGKTGNCGMFVVVIAEPSEGKSSCEALFFKAFFDFEETVRKVAKTKLTNYLAEHHTWASSIKIIKAAITKEVGNNANF